MSPPSLSKKRASSSTTPVFERGDLVEISSNDEGFEGSYYKANIMATLTEDEYIIQYRTLLNDDGFGPLREVVSADQIRPIPSENLDLMTEFSKGDLVDAYDKDGWWVGVITGKTGSKYIVYFEDADEQNAYPSDRLRIHQDWVNGDWVDSKKVKM